MKTLTFLILLVAGLQAASPIFRVVEIGFTIDPKDQNTNTTVYVEQSTDLVNWFVATNFPAVTNTIRLQVIQQQQMFRCFLSNAWTVSLTSEAAILPDPLTGKNPLLAVAVKPISP